MAGECELCKNIGSLNEKYFRNPKYNFFLSQDVFWNDEYFQKSFRKAEVLNLSSRHNKTYNINLNSQANLY